MSLESLFSDLPEGFRIAREEDLPLVRLTLSQSFADYGYPMPSTDVSHSARLRIMYDLFTGMTNNAMEHGAILTNEDFSAVMVVVPADKMCVLSPEELRDKMSGYSTPADGENLYAEFMRVDELEKQLRLRDNTVYIECFAVQTPRQGQKLGSRLMRQLFAQCAKEDRDILLYTNTDKNYSIYKHFGYECIIEDHSDEINFDTYFMLHKSENE